MGGQTGEIYMTEKKSFMIDMTGSLYVHLEPAYL